MGATEGAAAALSAGIGVADITPTGPIRMAGWASRDRASEGVSHPLYAKALALRDAAGHTGVWVTADILGYSRTMADTLERRLQDRYDLSPDQLILGSSHNHSGPLVGDLLHLYFDLEPAEVETVARYTEQLLERVVDVVGQALADLAPAELTMGFGLAGFGVNRRRARGADSLRRPQAVDHDVPVLAVRAPDGALRGILFGYACHTTAVYEYRINGDYAGYAQSSLEAAYPHSIALFAAGCGGDINPLPRWRKGLGESCGGMLSAAVQDVLDGRYGAMTPVTGALATGADEPLLSLPEPPGRAALQDALQRLGSDGSDVERRAIEHQLALLERGAPLLDHCPYPIRVWRFGSGQLVIALAGEPVVDYSLRFRAAYGWNRTWVAGYNHVLLAYIPSRRVLVEGDYEGTTGMLEYGLPGPFAGWVESAIARSVDLLVTRLSSEWYAAMAASGHPAASAPLLGDQAARSEPQDQQQDQPHDDRAHVGGA